MKILLSFSCLSLPLPSSLAWFRKEMKLKGLCRHGLFSPPARSRTCWCLWWGGELGTPGGLCWLAGRTEPGDAPAGAGQGAGDGAVGWGSPP